MRSPWSSYPGYTSAQVQDFNRAGEEAFMVKGSYDFSRLGSRESHSMPSGSTVGMPLIPSPRRPCLTRMNMILIFSGAPRAF